MTGDLRTTVGRQGYRLRFTRVDRSEALSGKKTALNAGPIACLPRQPGEDVIL
jgi:hypothetical protein